MRKSSWNLSFAGTHNDAKPLAQSAANADKSGDSMQFESGYLTQSGKWRFNMDSNLYRQTHRDDRFDFNRIGLNTRLTYQTRELRRSTELRLNRRLNDKAATGGDFASVWGMAHRGWVRCLS